MGAEVARVQTALADRTTPARAAILLDFDSCQSFRLTSTQGAPRVQYRALAEQYYAALQQAGVAVDVVYEPPAPGAYVLVVAPALRLMSAAWAERLRAFVEDGGTLVAAVACATLDPDHVVPAEPLPWRLTELFGIERVEWSALGSLAAPPKERAGEDASAWAHLGSADAVPVVADDGPLAGCFAAKTWIDHLALRGAEPLARFAVGSPAGTAPAVTLHQSGQGHAVYVAAIMEQELLNRLFANLITFHGHPPTAENALVEINPQLIVYFENIVLKLNKESLK